MTDLNQSAVSNPCAIVVSLEDVQNCKQSTVLQEDKKDTVIILTTRGRRIHVHDPVGYRCKLHLLAKIVLV